MTNKKSSKRRRRPTERKKKVPLERSDTKNHCVENIIGKSGDDAPLSITPPMEDLSLQEPTPFERWTSKQIMKEPIIEMEQFTSEPIMICSACHNFTAQATFEQSQQQMSATTDEHESTPTSEATSVSDERSKESNNNNSMVSSMESSQFQVDKSEAQMSSAHSVTDADDDTSISAEKSPICAASKSIGCLSPSSGLTKWLEQSMSTDITSQSDCESNQVKSAKISGPFKSLVEFMRRFVRKRKSVVRD